MAVVAPTSEDEVEASQPKGGGGSAGANAGTVKEGIVEVVHSLRVTNSPPPQGVSSEAGPAEADEASASQNEVVKEGVVEVLRSLPVAKLSPPPMASSEAGAAEAEEATASVLEGERGTSAKDAVAEEVVDEEARGSSTAGSVSAAAAEPSSGNCHETRRRKDWMTRWRR